jgi:gamma-glutamylcyclotransferase (GGCT)/AIG2-like uncharacterized protein YtfP
MAKVNESARQWVANGILDTMDINRKNTVDLPILNQFENHYVFVYGTLKVGESRSSALSFSSENLFLGAAETVEGNFEMTVSPVGHFPIVLENTGNTTRQGQVHGQLYLVPTKTILRLDTIEGNGNIFFREYRPIKTRFYEVLAYTYLGVSQFWREAPMIDYPLTDGKYNYHDHTCTEVIEAWEKEPILV